MTKNKKNANKTRSSLTKRNMKFLSWNIQAPSTTDGNKFGIKEFKNVITQHDFACLQEVREVVHPPGYKTECSIRKGSWSGGVAIMVKKELTEGIEFIENLEWTDYLICRLKKYFFRLDKDIFLVNVYAKPYNTTDIPTTSQFISGKDVIKKVEEAINDLRKGGKVILCGDFNARIGQKTGIVLHDSDEFLPMPDNYIPDENTPRFSQDTKTNTYGTHFLNIIMNNQLTILNGRTLGDMTGNFTSVQKPCWCVVDYFAISQALENDVNYMKVLDQTPYSDHKPLSMELHCKHIQIECMLPLEQQYEPAPTRFIFNKGNRDAFIQGLFNRL